MSAPWRSVATSVNGSSSRSSSAPHWSGSARLDVAFANAGFGAPRGFLASDVEHWRAMVLTNVYGVALTIRATLEALRESRGHLLMTGSVAGRRVLRGSLYSATKWAVTAMAEAARQELH